MRLILAVNWHLDIPPECLEASCRILVAYTADLFIHTPDEAQVILMIKSVLRVIFG